MHININNNYNNIPNLRQTTRSCDSQQKREPADLWTLRFRLITG